MNIISQFASIAKKETVGRSNIRSLIKDMHSDVVDYRKNNQADESIAVAETMTRKQFAKAYRNLQATSLISFSFVLFMIAYFFLAEGWMIKFTISAFFVISFLWHLSFVIRAYRARLVYDDWEKRLKPLKIGFEEVADALIHDPRVFAPFVMALNTRDDIKYDNINKNKGFKKG